MNVDGSQFRDVWLVCPKCEWHNGFDLGLEWAEYVVKQLKDREISLQRIGELVDELRTWQGTTAEFFASNQDVSSGPLAWIGRISLPTLLAVLTFMYLIYSGQRNAAMTREQIHLTQEQIQIAEQAEAKPEPQVLTQEDIRLLATELHRLQQTIQIMPPPSGRRRR